MSDRDLCRDIRGLSDHLAARMDDLIEQVETLTTGQRAAIGAKSLEMLKEEARERQVSGLKQGDKLPLVSDDTNGDSDGNHRVGRASEIAAKQVGVGVSSINRAALVMREDPEAFERIKEGEANR